MQLLTFAATAQRMGFKSRSFVYEQLAEGILPKPIQFGERALRFPSTEIDAVIAARIAGKSKADIQALVAQLHTERTKAGMPAPAATPEPKANALQLVGA